MPAFYFAVLYASLVLYVISCQRRPHELECFWVGSNEMLSDQSSSDDIIVARNAFGYRESMLGVAIGLAIPLWRTGAPIRCSFSTFFDGFASVALSWFPKKKTGQLLPSSQRTRSKHAPDI